MTYKLHPYEAVSEAGAWVERERKEREEKLRKSQGQSKEVRSTAEEPAKTESPQKEALALE